MATFTDFNQKAALLSHKASIEGWLSAKKGNSTTIPGTQISLNTIRYWREAEHTYTETHIVSDWLKTRLGVTDPRNLFSDNVDVKEFSKLLGYTTDQGREIIDQTYTELYPAYSIFYSSKRAAIDTLRAFGRFNLLYRIDSNELVKGITKSEIGIVQMPLTLRYMLKSTKKQAERLFRVRCKLTIPSYIAATKHFVYDGYITPQEWGTHYWIFESRNEQNRDLVFMITEYQKRLAHDVPEVSRAQGIMITRRQGDHVHKIWKVVLLKVEQSDSRYFDPTDASDPESKFMDNHCKIITKDKVEPWLVDDLERNWEAIDLSSIKALR